MTWRGVQKLSAWLPGAAGQHIFWMYSDSADSAYTGKRAAYWPGAVSGSAL
jgi:hypothetical protein